MEVCSQTAIFISRLQSSWLRVRTSTPNVESPPESNYGGPDAFVRSCGRARRPLMCTGLR